MKELNPIRQGNGGYILKFRHPLLKRPASFGLGTKDEVRAHRIAHDATLLFNNPSVLQAPTPETLIGYDPRSVEIVFGDERAKSLLDGTAGIQQAITPEDAKELEATVKLHSEWMEILKTEQVVDQSGGLSKLLETFTPKNHALLIGLCQRQSDQIKLLEARNCWLESEFQKLSKKTNAQVKATIQEAFEIFKRQYVNEIRTQTFNENSRYVQSFVDSLTEKGNTRLALIDSGDVDNWVSRLKADDGQALQPRTIRNRRNAISRFFSWCKSKYRLNDNPVGACLPIPGVARHLHEIKAIDRLSDLQDFFASLESESYWKAWVMTACLAGPRFSEQCGLKISDVYLDQDGDYLRIVGTKTGRVRKVNIEKTKLLVVLKDFVKTRKAEQDAVRATPAQKSDFLFPSLVENASLPRENSEPGKWSHNAAFHFNYTKLVCRVGSSKAKQAALHYLELRREVRRKAKSEKWDSKKRKQNKVEQWTSNDYWAYGPSEWRHTFGTILAHCGFTSLEISRFMGNSPAVADRHYIKSAASGGDKRWDFNW